MFDNLCIPPTPHHRNARDIIPGMRIRFDGEELEVREPTVTIGARVCIRAFWRGRYHPVVVNRFFQIEVI